MCYNRHVTEEGKVLTGLIERRALEAAFDELAQAQEPAERVRLAQELAGRSKAILPVFLARLATEDPHVRGGLGLLAQQMDRDVVVPALKGVLRASGHSLPTRTTALTLLERYLDEPVEESLLAVAADPDSVARQSLRELIQAMDRNPAAVIEYLTQLAQQPADTPGLLMRALPALMPHPHLITLLRMFAQGEDVRLAQQALEQLGRTRTAEALLALISLTAMLPADLRPVAERNLRKVRMSGVLARPAIPAERWKVLLSPVDGRGARVLWFIAEEPDAGRPTGLVIVIADETGIIGAADAAAFPPGDVPPTVPAGEVLAVPQPGGVRPLLLAGVTFDAGRRVVWQALEQNWSGGRRPPLGYRFLGDRIWQYGPLDEEALAGPAIAADPERLGGDTAALLDHEAFADWSWPTRALYEAVADTFDRWPLPPPARAMLVRHLAETAFGADDAAVYRRRLIAMAEWLAYTRQNAAAQLAATAAAQLRDDRPGAAPFVQRLIDRSLEIVALDIRFRSRRGRKPA
ncbi:MAG: hypothetical protein N2439_15235 [Anaerolineae bacterium]|nr:hypothetical protein [Anaerolineae bacterium]